MLDDVGTKAAPRDRLNACPPSYLIETSPDIFQAGYLFSEPCADLTQVEALQEALVSAGLCDPGANGPATRLGRLPVGLNGKYEPPHPCRLIEWHPERRYGIEEIVDRLELQTARTKGKRCKQVSRGTTIDANAELDVYLPRAPENAVLRALRDRGLYKRPLGDGRHEVTCPWVHEHTDQLDHGAAYFEPSDLYPVGGFKCQHSHGADKRIGALLEFLGVSLTEAKHKPTIRVSPGELHRVVDAAERELAQGGRHYQRGGLIVAVQTDPATRDTQIKPTSANALMRALSASASRERYDARSGTFVVTDPPSRHVNVLYDAESYVHLPVLRAIARQPYLRGDGSLMTASGFDEPSGMFGAFADRDFAVPERPSRQHALKALTELEALLAEFSFANPHDKAAALAAMLTGAIRAALPLAPMFHVRAPQIASGKSYLCSLIAAFAGPSKPSAVAFPTNEEECAKLLLSTLLEAPSVLMFDNLTTDLRPFKSLCSALTEESITGRVLGVSKTATVPTTTLVLSSGNNVSPVQDMGRRCVTINLDPRCETPAARIFRSDPVEQVRANRGRFVSLALTIVRAYLVAGSPRQEFKALGSYGAWSGLVRAPLIWLGQPDPAAAVFTAMAEDPEHELLGRLLVAWKATFGTSAAGVRDAVDRVLLYGGRKSELAEVLHEVADERGEINRRRLGRWIARHQGRIVNGLRFERHAARSCGSERWGVRVISVSGVSGSDGEESVIPVPDDVEVI
jgi:hypothetical protein